MLTTNSPPPPHSIDHDAHCKVRWTSEQYLFVSSLKKKFKNLDYPHRLMVTREIKEMEKRFLLSNFTVIDSVDWKFDNFKHPFSNIIGSWMINYSYYDTLYKYNDFQKDYKKFLDKKYKIKLNSYFLNYIMRIFECAQRKEKLYLRLFSVLLKELAR